MSLSPAGQARLHLSTWLCKASVFSWHLRWISKPWLMCASRLRTQRATFYHKLSAQVWLLERKFSEGPVAQWCTRLFMSIHGCLGITPQYTSANLSWRSVIAVPEPSHKTRDTSATAQMDLNWELIRSVCKDAGNKPRLLPVFVVVDFT